MSDDLRTRIAAVLQEHPPVRLQSQFDWLDWTEKRADAVIRELGLRQEQRDLMDGECGQSINYITGKVTNHYRAATRQSRYVTDWTADA